MARTRELYFDFAVCGLFAVIVALLYHSALGSCFLYDDPFLLRSVVGHSPLEYFYKPAVLRQFSASYLTPWVPLSYGMDLMLSGINPKFFYLHQLVSVWLVSVMIYVVLKKWAGRFAAFGAVFFLFSAPVAVGTEILMFRHYIEGSFFALLSFYFFSRSMGNTRSSFYLVLSTVFYAAAISAKEIFLPLGIIVLFLPEGDLKKRMRHAAPLLCVLALYIPWRHAMLGSLVGGPGKRLFPGYEGVSAITLLIKDVYGSLCMMSGGSSAGSLAGPMVAAVFLCLVAVSSLILVKEKHFLPILFFAMMLLSVYAAPLSVVNFSRVALDDPTYRLMVLVDMCLTIVLTVSANFLYRRLKLREQGRALPSALLRTLMVLVLAGTAFLVLRHSTRWIENERTTVFNPLAAEGRFFLTADKGALLVKSNPLYGGFFYYENLEYFRKLYRNESSPMVTYDFFAYVDDPDSPVLRNMKVYKYNSETSTVTDITPSYMKERAAYFARVRALPLEVSFSLDGGDFRYSSGPSDSGRYFLLLGYKPDLYCMKIEMRQFAIRLPDRMKMYCRVGWESPDGRVTFSPEWLLDSAKKQNILWRRR